MGLPDLNVKASEAPYINIKIRRGIMPDTEAFCEFCKQGFPSRLIATYIENEKTWQSCPICALAKRNTSHGLPAGTPFKGKKAKQMYEDAKKYIANKAKK